MTAGTSNGIAAALLLHGHGDDPAVGGVLFKRDDTKWGIGKRYLDAQPFAVLSPSKQLGSDTTGDYSGLAGPGQNPGLFRIDQFGGVGTVQGIHVAPGLRDTYGGGDPIGIWIQLGSGKADVPGLIISMPPASSKMRSPAIAVENAAGKVLAEVNAGGAWVSRAAAAGIVLTDTVTGHYVRYVSSNGRLVGTDIGTAIPLT